MACRFGVARWGLQRSLVRTLQVLRVALARSPTARIRAWARLTFSAGRRVRSVAVTFERGPDAAVGALVGLVSERHHLFGGQGVAVTQMSQGEQCLPAGIQAPPPGLPLLALGADEAG